MSDLRERSDASRWKLWLLVDADRRLVTLGLALIVFLGAMLAARLLPGATLSDGDPVETLFQATLTATVTGVTLVVTLNQLVLSQELGAAGDQRDRMEEATAFRESVARAVSAPVSPARPSAFLRALVDTAAGHARRLDRHVGSRAGRRAANDDADAPGGDGRAASGEPAADGGLTTDLGGLIDWVTTDADRASARLADAQFGGFDAVAAALEFDYSRALFAARRIDAQYDLDEETASALSALIETLELFGPAREHVKTLYFQWELIELSRAVLVASVPALLVSAGMVAFFDPASAPTVAGRDTAVFAVAAGLAFGLFPFFVLLSYVLRIATVTKRTLAIGPFVLRTTEQVEHVDWEE